MIHPIGFYNIRYSFFNPKGHSVLKAYESREDMENRLREERSSLESSINANNSEQNSCSGKISLLESRINDKARTELSELKRKHDELESKLNRVM